MSDIEKNKAWPDSCYSRLFSSLYDYFMASAEKKKFGKRRNEVLSQVTGNVLEVGSGTGVNFQYYTDKVDRLIACEPSKGMMAKAKVKLEALQAEGKGVEKDHVLLLQAGVGDEEFLARVPVHSQDVIVLTLVLCTIPDPDACVRWLKTRLKPDGRIIVLEHVRASGFPGWFQNLIQPLWYYIGDGCNLNRDTEGMLKGHGFTAMKGTEEKFYLGGGMMPVYFAQLELPPTKSCGH